MDFTLTIYKSLLNAFINKGYEFQTYAEFTECPKKKCIILRHDVDKKPNHSLMFAKIQSLFDIKGSYYFRMVPSSYNEKIIKEIAELGHEIGYHYETMDITGGDSKKAIEIFKNDLNTLSRLVAIKTICMHGSPMSKFDNRELWKYYNYKDFGITAEPYFDIDFESVFYLTDTGRKFDGDKVSFRDKPMQSISKKWPVYHKTTDIIKAIEKGSFPQVAMITFHPQRWSDNLFEWLGEYILQNIKNVIKRMLVKKNSKT